MSGENLDIAAIMVSPIFMLGGGVIGYEIGGNIGCLMLMTAYPILLAMVLALYVYRVDAARGQPDIIVPVTIGAVPTAAMAVLGYDVGGAIGAAMSVCVVPAMFIVAMVADDLIRRYVPDDAEAES